MHAKYISRGLLILLLNIAAVLYAHHAFESEFDTTRALTIQGKVTKIEWSTPHVYVNLDVAGTPSGTDWRAELASPNELVRKGLKQNSIPIGGTVRIEGFGAKSGDRIVGTTQFTLLATGETFMVTPTHHSYADEFDNAKPVNLTGTVVSVDRTDAHSTIRLSVASANGPQSWLAIAPRSIVVQPGDELEASGAGARNGSLSLFARQLTRVASNGTRLTNPTSLIHN